MLFKSLFHLCELNSVVESFGHIAEFVVAVSVDHVHALSVDNVLIFDQVHGLTVVEVELDLKVVVDVDKTVLWFHGFFKKMLNTKKSNINLFFLLKLFIYRFKIPFLGLKGIKVSKEKGGQHCPPL